MSRSRFAAQAGKTAAPKERRAVVIDVRGRARAGWLLALSLLIYAAAALLMRTCLSAGFAALFRAWAVDASTAALAPGWAQLLYAWHGSLVTVLAGAAVLALVRPLRRLWRLTGEGPGFSVRAAVGFWAIGTGFAALITALCLLPDSMRLEWPLARPRITAALPGMWLVTLIGVLAEEAFARCVVYDGLKSRWGAGWATLCAGLLFFLMNSGWTGNALCAVNVLLLGLICCLVYARRGLCASTAFRWGWSFANVFLLGFGGGNQAVYRLYGVSERWLTGGEAGYICGGWATLLFVATLLWLAKGELQGLIGQRTKP